MKPLIKEDNTPTETEVLYWELPKKMVDELGFELYNEGDVVYIQEIHFDTQNVLFSFYTKESWGEEVHYDDSVIIPSRFEGYKPISIKKLPRAVLNFIGRRLDPRYVKYIEL